MTPSNPTLRAAVDQSRAQHARRKVGTGASGPRQHVAASVTTPSTVEPNLECLESILPAVTIVSFRILAGTKHAERLSTEMPLDLLADADSL